MKYYDYVEALRNDIRQYIDDNDWRYDFTEGREYIESELYDDMFVADSVTGNGSGSYTFNSDEAFENLRGNLDLLAEANEMFGGGVDILKSGAEACDVTIRCYLLSSALYDVLNEIYSDND